MTNKLNHLANLNDGERLTISENVLTDLRERLLRTRQARPVGKGWASGTDPEFLYAFLDFWAKNFDWTTTQKQLDIIPQHLITVDDVTIHVFHVIGKVTNKSQNPIPIVLTHGWPSSFLEYIPLLNRLTDPLSFGVDSSDVFDVVVPSLPGIGLSTLPVSQPVQPALISDLWIKVMNELGYQKFGAHGGDIGSHVTNFLGAKHAGQLIAIHTHHPCLHPILDPSKPLSSIEQKYLDMRMHNPIHDNSYSKVQRAKPNSLAPGLSDSPAGLAAWILEKYHDWTDNDGDLESVLDMKSLAEILTVYWASNCIGSSFQHYHDDFATPPLQTVNVPCGISLTPEDADYPREFATRTYTNIRQWRGPSPGGHFLALEKPDRLAQDLRDLFRPFRKKAQGSGR